MNLLHLTNVEENKNKKKTVKHMLKRDETLKVYAKGRYGESIEEIEAVNIPINAKSKLLAMR